MQNYPLVSVCTCVYNGERTIERVFKSMRALQYPNIEHVIVNDGSVDNTEKMIQEYIGTVTFPVKYHKKENGGKHSALNVAWDLAEGEFMVQLDADDELLPHSINFLVNTYYQIPEEIRSQYWCVHGRYMTQNGDFVGDPYPERINDKHWKEAGKDAGKCGGDKVGLQVRKYLCPYRFPEVKGLAHVPEGIIWRQINEQYGTWYTNEVISIYYVGEGGNLTAKMTKRRQAGPPCYYQKWQLMHPDWYNISFKNLLMYSLFYFITDNNYRKHNGYLEGLQKYKLPLVLLCPITYVGAFVCRKLKGIQ